MSNESQSLRKCLQIYKGLVEVSCLINSITDYNELLRAILNVARRVIQAEASSLFLVNAETGSLELSIATSGESAFVEPKVSVPRGRGIAGWVFEHGEPLLIPDAYADERFYKEADRQTGFVTRSIICVPLKRDSLVIGVLQVLNPRNKPTFDQEDLEGFSAYANLTATAIEKLRAVERMRAQERVERDIAIAAEIQRELLSRAIPEAIDGAVFASHNVPAVNVGGDFYEVFVRNANEIFFAIGDVSGKGIPASLLMAQTLSAMQFVFSSTSSPAAALAILNETLHASAVRGMFVTTLVGKLIPSSRTLELASAGHCMPILIGPDSSAVRLDVASSLPIGITRNVKYGQTAWILKPGERLLAYTDGLSESRSEADGEMFDEILVASAAGRATGPRDILERVLAAELSHRRGSPQLDDLTVLVGGFE